MMAYDSQFVLCVLHNGSPVREIGNAVHLPFHSEYKIRLKNKHSFLRATARVWVDGRQASNLGDFILKPGETLDLERFLDHSMSSGNKFKFVPLSDGRVNDPTDPENGIIKVEFYREVNYINQWNIKIDPIKIDPKPWPRRKSPNIRGGGDFTWDDSSATPMYFSSPGGTTNSFNSSSAPIGSTLCSSEVYDSCPTPVSAGATVEGGYSGQGFNYGTHFETEAVPVTLTLRVKGLKKGRWDDEFEIAPPPQHKKRKRMVKFCPNCGARRNRKADHFCERCGTAYHPRYENERGRISR